MTDGELIAVVTLRLYRDGDDIVWVQDAVVSGGDPRGEDDNIRRALIEAAAEIARGERNN